MPRPIVLITGVDFEAMESVLVGLSWDLPSAVSVQHRIDPSAHVLTRVVSDSSGELERVHIPLEHACVSCAIREDIVPTLERVARDGRWDTVVACLPVGAEATQVGAVIAGRTELAASLRITSVIAAVNGPAAVDDLLGDDLLRERERHTGPDDARGLGEVACAIVEYADIVALSAGGDATAVGLVTALARPDAVVVNGSEHLSGLVAVEPRHLHQRTSDWVAPTFDIDVPRPDPSGNVWQLDLATPRPFHPGRLLEQIGRLGGGRHRSRGSFWLPTRPDDIQVWNGAGGQLSIGRGRVPPGHARRTRLLLTGTGPAPADITRAFDELTLSDAEANLPASAWGAVTDGFEPWLGDIREAA